MPWRAFFSVLLIVFVLQTAAARQLGIESLDLLLAYALFCALALPTGEARVAAMIVGLAQDLGSGGFAGSAAPIGASAFCFGVSGLLVTWLRERLNTQIGWVRLLVAFLAAVPGQLLLAGYTHWWLSAWRMPAGQTFLHVTTVSMLAALLAVGLTNLPLFLKWDRRRRGRARPRW
ncbi:MAG: hypothetical protein IPM64_08435 [Phycisphaerales bacterium]|nr:hypothetical protein [Phycisphaerales bacterium]